MNTVRNANRNVIVSVIMTLMLIAAMMPGMAFAAEGYGVTITGPTMVLTGTNPQMTADVTQPEGSVTHVDWVSSNKNVATISVHKGKITPKAEGTTTITANLMEGEAPTGTGGGSGSPCEGTPLATASITVEVEQAATGEYGFQGTGGNMLKMLNLNITPGNLTDEGYLNMINDLITLSEGTCEFEFTMSAGMNTFNAEKFIENNLPYIQILDMSGQPVAGASVTMNEDTCFDPTDKGITITVKDLTSGMYKLQFGAEISGNNADKTLGVPITFQFMAL